MPRPVPGADLLAGSYKVKVQYSTPGVAGDGTALLIKALHDFGGKEPATDLADSEEKRQ